MTDREQAVITAAVAYVSALNGSRCEAEHPDWMKVASAHYALEAAVANLTVPEPVRGAA